MKKMAKFFTVLVVTLFATVLLTGCSGSQHELVGSWNWEDAGILWYTFDRDGTGVMLQDIDFTWEVSGNTVTITAEGVPMRWQYSISGNTLTLTNAEEGLEYSYIRQ